MGWTSSTRMIREWLQGLVAVNIPDDALNNILDGRDIAGTTPLMDVSFRDAELLKADVYMWVCTTPSVSRSLEDADGFWRHREGSSTMMPRDKDLLIRLANAIYEKYGEATVAQSGLRLVSL